MPRANPAPGAVLSLRHPAHLAAAAVAAAAILLTITYRIYEGDVWQHLLVGKVIWERHAIPRSNLWTWPTAGSAQVLPSWGFRALIWPFWSAGGVAGLFVWRWIAALATFGLAWAAARILGARGFAPLFVAVLGCVVAHERFQVRPETFAALLLAAQIALLESRRRRWAGHAVALTAIAWIWVNTHISYPIGLAVLAVYAAEEALRGGRGGIRGAGGAAPRQPPEGSALGDVTSGARRHLPLSIVLALSAAVSIANPFGWRALWQPFEFFLVSSKEPIFRAIGELQPIRWSENLANGLPLLVAGWALFGALRARRRGADLVEIALGAIFLAAAARAQRFLGLLGVVAVPFFGRDLDDALASWRGPAWTRHPASRVLALAAGAIAVGLPTWLTPFPSPGIGVEWSKLPVRACDVMIERDVRGRGFNTFFLGGYLLWRTWPEPGRLPFMDIHQTGTPEDRGLYVAAHSDPAAWRALDAKYRFDWVLLNRILVSPGERLLDLLDADSTWALVFVDDAAALYVRRNGQSGAAAGDAYRLVSGGGGRVSRATRAALGDPALRAELRAELERAAASSPYSAEAHARGANLDMIEGRLDDAKGRLAKALSANPFAPRLHERLGLIALARGRPRDALGEFLQERRLRGRSAGGLELRIAQAYQAMGDEARARNHYLREARRSPAGPEAAEARDSLAAIGRRGS